MTAERFGEWLRRRIPEACYNGTVASRPARGCIVSTRPGNIGASAAG